MVKPAWTVVVVVVIVMTMMETRVESKVNYDCLFGPMYSGVDPRTGEMRYFCQLGMINVPFMDRGQYVTARHPNGKCYECVCEESFGKACCEIDRC